MVTSTLDNGWLLYETHLDGFSIALPPDWLHINLNAETFADTLALGTENDPEVNDLLSGNVLLGLVASGIKFYAVDPSLEAVNLGLPTTLNV